VVEVEVEGMGLLLPPPVNTLLNTCGAACSTSL
jgi:hypothetical protein